MTRAKHAIVHKHLSRSLPRSWARVLSDELSSPYFAALEAFVREERALHPVYPPADRVFAAFEQTPFDSVKVVLVGQDPYHGPGQADGLCLSVRPGVPTPPSLGNMFKELGTDLGCRLPDNGCLSPWAQQGVLLLNAVLTVREGAAASHQGKGWELFTDAVIRALDNRETPVVFALFGAQARKKAQCVAGQHHRIVEGVHPSPLSAHAGFFGSRPFSRINDGLVTVGHTPIDWQLSDLGVPIVPKTRKVQKSAHPEQTSKLPR